MVNVSVDLSCQLGKIKPMHAINNMPTVPLNTENDWDGKLKAAHIPYGRLHDTGGAFGGARFVDIPNVFPNFDADENDPASYDFAFTDALLARMVNSGIQPYYRLGVTIENYQSIKAYHLDPPKDFAKWARICEHIILHYNEGWANGFHYGMEYWEIWNEPDNYPDVEDNQMWHGTMEQYFELYTVTAKHLKSRFPHLKIGGYASCGFYAMNNVDVSNIAHSTSRTDYFIEFFHKFLQHISAEKAPLDFFSWHTYASLKNNILFAAYPRKYLDEYGYTECEIHCNEWNPGTALRGTLKDAANILSHMIVLHDTPTDMMMYYDLRFTSSYCGPVNPLNLAPFKAYYAFYTFGQLYALAQRVSCSTDTDGVYALAAGNANKSAAVIVNCQEQPVQLCVSGMPTTARLFLTDQTHDHAPIEGDLNDLTLDASAIVYIEA